MVGLHRSIIAPRNSLLVAESFERACVVGRCDGHEQWLLRALVQRPDEEERTAGAIERLGGTGKLAGGLHGGQTRDDKANVAGRE